MPHHQGALAALCGDMTTVGKIMKCQARTRKVSEEASNAMRCAWKRRPSTRNVTSLSVALFTYCSPRYTCWGGQGAAHASAACGHKCARYLQRGRPCYYESLLLDH